VSDDLQPDRQSGGESTGDGGRRVTGDVERVAELRPAEIVERTAGDAGRLVLAERERRARERRTEQQVVADHALLELQREPGACIERRPNGSRVASGCLIDQAGEPGGDQCALLGVDRVQRREHRDPQCPLDPPGVVQAELDLLDGVAEALERL
jgi:hypothetical protein